MKPSNGVPNNSEFGKIVSYLAKNGIKPSDIISRIGNTPKGRTRKTITKEIISWLKTGIK